MRRIQRVIAVLAILLPTLAHAKTASEIRAELRKLNVVGSALYVAAHPDDENTAMLAWLSNERQYRTSYLSVTRGDGGQNLLGDEKGELLGVIRTQELLAARRIDGAEQYFTRAVDFGFTKSPVETLAIWDHDKVLADVVWAIRKLQPDVIITRFPTTGEGGHGQHTASAILAGEAFTAAGDPTKFPEQLKYVNVWQPKRLVYNRISWREVRPEDVIGAIPVDIGAYNRVLGRSYTEIAAESRSQHKSQGFGSAERRGSIINYFHVLNGAPAASDLFEGVDTTWSRYPGGEAVGKILKQAVDTFDASNPSASIPLLLQATEALDRLGANDAWSSRAHPWIEVKRNELLNAIRDCAGLSIDVAAADSSVVAGGEIPVSVTVINRSDYPFVLSTVASRFANPGKAPGTPLKNNQPVKTDISVKLPNDYAYSQPYWLMTPPSKGMFEVADQTLIGLPENPPSVPITVAIDDNQQHSLIFTVPAIYRWTDAVRGEQTRRVDVVPDVTANLDQRVYVFPDGKAKPVTIGLRNFGGASDGTVRLVVPNGWSVSPANAPVKFAAKGEEARVTFSVTPPANETNASIAAEVALANGRTISKSIANIEYPHIPAQRVFSEAKAKVERVDIKKTGTRIGYIMGAGDEVPDALRQIGYDVTLLSDADLDRGDFSRFDAVVVGIRAYNARRAMKAAHPKLMQYVQNGGTLVVQYNSLSPQPLLVNPPGPYPFTVTDQRVTVEEAPVQFLDPSHPLLNTPNKITQKDLEGWVQERGLYFTKDADPKYTPILASHDPNEADNPGGELYARAGKGRYVYTAYAWFRQLPAGVPGALKMFANLVSAK